EMFQAALLGSNVNVIGQIQVNGTANDGSGMVTMQGGPKTSALTLKFCPFYPDPYGNGTVPATPCYDVTVFTTDASGNAQVTFHFPKSGKFFGAFRVQQNGTTVAVSGYTYTSTPDYHASVQTAAGTTDVSWQTFTL